MVGESKRRRDILGDVATELTRKLTDEGLLIEAGWVVYDRYVVPATAGAVQREETKLAFMAGAGHLFSSMFAMLDPTKDDEPTQADFDRLTQIRKELEAWTARLSERMTPAQGKA